MIELNFASYVDTICPFLMRHSKKEEAALFLLEAVCGQQEIALQEQGKTKNLKTDGTLGRLLRGVLPVPENIRLATATPEGMTGVVAYFRSEVAQDINPHLKADLADSFKALIARDTTIPDSKKESLKALEDQDLFLAETFIYALNRFHKPVMEDGDQRISIPLLIFTFCFGIAIYACTMYTMIKMGEVSMSLMAFAFFFSIGLFVFLISFYFFLWRRDI